MTDWNIHHHHHHQNGDRHKPSRSLIQLIGLDAIHFGTEFCYATQTALVTPIVLRLGLPSQLFGIPWLAAPVFGSVLTPLIWLGSERCRSSWGRRRPFLLALALGIIVGVVLSLNGGNIGRIITKDNEDKLWSIVITLLGIAVVDFCLQATSFPAKAYLVDVCNIDDVKKVINIRIVLGGLGGGLGYIFSAIDWMSTAIGTTFGSELRVICLFNIIFYTVCVIISLCSVTEVPLKNKGRSSSSSSSSTSSSVSYCCCCCVEGNTEASFDTMRDVVETCQVKVNTPDINDDDDEEKEDYVNGVGDNIERKDDEEGEVVVRTSDREKLLGYQTGSIQTGLPRATTEKTHTFQRDKPSRRSRRDRSWRGLQAKQASGSHPARSDDPYHIQFFPSPDAPNEPARKTHDREEITQHQSAYKVDVDVEYSSKQSLNDAGVAGAAHVSNNDDQPAICPVNTGEFDGASNNVLSPEISINHVDHDVAAKDVRDHSTRQDDATSYCYLMKSSINMPYVLRRLFFTHCVSWVAFFTMLLYFTEYMAAVLYLGDPGAPSNSPALLRYNSGVRMGCWGLSIYSVSAALTGLLLTRLERTVTLRTLHVFGQLIFAVGCGSLLLIVDMTPYATMAMCTTFGIEFAIITRIPPSILAIYHRSDRYKYPHRGLVRCYATDYTCLVGQVFFAQIIVSTLVELVVYATGTRLTIVAIASTTAFLSALLSACFVSYEL